MRMRILGNVWREGRAFYPGEVIDAPEPEAERLAVLGVAEPVSAELPRHNPEPVEVHEMAESAEPVDSQLAPEPVKPKRKRGKR